MKMFSASILFLVLAGCVSISTVGNTDKNFRSIAEDKAQLSNQSDYQRLWDKSNFTDPKHHKEENFRYVVHASAELGFYNKVLPQRKISGFGRLSVSVINQDHVGTFRNAGVILSVPQKNFIAASDEDMGECSTDETPEKLKNCFYERFTRFGLPSPQEVLQRSMRKDPTHWNEIFVSESPLAIEDPKIAALFLRVDSFGHCLAEINLCRELTNLSHKFAFPLIKIPPPRNEIWLVGYPKGGKIETSFGYFFRTPPFDEITLSVTQFNYKTLEETTRKSGKKLFITSSEYIFGATPVGVIINNRFFHITSQSDYGTVMKSDITHQYIFSDKATPIIFSQEK